MSTPKRPWWQNPPYLLLAAGALPLVWLLVVSFSGSPTAARPQQPEPIVQGNQLRFPAGHPQLALLSTVAAAAATEVRIELPAHIVWDESVTQRVYPAFAGRVQQLNADVGQRVQAGQVLATLLSPEFGTAQADTAKARADALVAKRAAERMQTLFEADVVSRKEYEQAQADAERAQAELARASARTQLYGHAAGVNQALPLLALVNGVVVERNLSAGLEVRPDASGAPPLFVISDPTQLWVQIDVREGDAEAVRPGTRLQLNLAALPSQTFTAEVVTSADRIDPQSRTFKIRARLHNPERRVKAEMLGTAQAIKPMPAGVVLPATAVQLRGTDHWVYVQVAAGVFEPRKVILAHETRSEVLAVDGVRVGELVVKDNTLLLAREFRFAKDAAPPSIPAP
ncbi:MAG: efflux RND transporter periplasmic adaptor subunit [Limnohabitans sp.]|nr:efflux RND transporter periplasmic adaptor subunit [Limnohabitans sp.]